MRVLNPVEGIYAFYDGREEEPSGAQTWVEDGALSLGIATYAVVDGEEALVYDTHVSVDRAALMREELERRGAARFTVLLSHWHLDHVAGTGAFADCEILAGARTAEHLRRHREAIEAGTLEGPPAIAPLVMPTRVLEGRTSLAVGDLEVELIPFDIHSDDATLVWLADRRVLLAGDTVEDTVTYVGEPEKLEVHRKELTRLAALGAERILPSHGSAETIAAGGYSNGLVEATAEYVDALLRLRAEPEATPLDLRELMSGPLEAGWITYFPPYKRVHEANVALVTGSGG